MNKFIKLTFFTVFFLASSLALACDYPERPHIPDGSTTSKDKLLTAKSDVQNYIAAVDEYLQCVEDKEKAAIAELADPAPEELQRRNDLLNKKFDAANEEKALVGEQFNQQIRAYNQALKESKE
ncbi:MAG: hypothetical protein OEU90_00130 [Gammaproteobacteria bacterium]|jgi:hypothetical protein|nr:hypothetical protein [Gammaproteobacteria bacterium]MDH3750704.1 hypothetical protein [Gammaproteobacteria bacterium]MDH3803853.1 hypothetical protein [Gammaproteobacteria bacterium]